MGALQKTVVLIGMMGAGKSTIGRRLALRLDVKFCDADAEIEAAAGCTIAEIFARYGETEFRDGERRVIARLLRDPPHVLATGGGAFMNPSTRAQVAADCFSIWLKVPLEILVERIGRRDTRPLVRQGDPREIMERLLREREPVYAQADLTVDMQDGPHAVAVEQIVAALRSRDFVGPA